LHIDLFSAQKECTLAVNSWVFSFYYDPTLVFEYHFSVLEKHVNKVWWFKVWYLIILTWN